jgi:hypothetical protein
MNILTKAKACGKENNIQISLHIKSFVVHIYYFIS